MATRNRAKGNKKSLLDMLDLSTPIARQAIRESNEKIAAHRQMLEDKGRKRAVEEKQREEERQKTLTERTKLAKENESQRNLIREQKRKASEAALERLVESRKRARRS